MIMVISMHNAFLVPIIFTILPSLHPPSFHEMIFILVGHKIDKYDINFKATDDHTNADGLSLESIPLPYTQISAKCLTPTEQIYVTCKNSLILVKEE